MRTIMLLCCLLMLPRNSCRRGGRNYRLRFFDIFNSPEQDFTRRYDGATGFRVFATEGFLLTTKDAKGAKDTKKGESGLKL
ncbi:MAG: hypothetical protein JW874_00495, partial [Spirochaetales bacterium]|nr:hypothetical protein [Spirochaetales bacterium]